MPLEALLPECAGGGGTGGRGGVVARGAGGGVGGAAGLGGSGVLFDPWIPALAPFDSAGAFGEFWTAPPLSTLASVFVLRFISLGTSVC